MQEMGLLVGVDVIDNGACFDASFNLLAEGMFIFDRQSLAKELAPNTHAFEDLFLMTRYSEPYEKCLMNFLKADGRLPITEQHDAFQAKTLYVEKLLGVKQGHYGLMYSTVGELDLYVVAKVYNVALTIFFIQPSLRRFQLLQFFYDRKNKNFQEFTIVIDDNTTIFSLLLAFKKFRDLCTQIDKDTKHMAMSYNGYHFQPLPPTRTSIDLSAERVVGYGGTKEKKDTVIVEKKYDSESDVSLQYWKISAQPFRRESMTMECYIRSLYPFPRTSLARISKSVILPQSCEIIEPPINNNQANCLVMNSSVFRSSLANLYKKKPINSESLQIVSANILYAAQELISLNGDFPNRHTVITHNDVSLNNIVVPSSGHALHREQGALVNINSIIDLEKATLLRFSTNGTIEMATVEMKPGALGADHSDALNTFRRVTFVRTDVSGLPPYRGKVYSNFPFLQSGPHADLGALVMLLVWFIAAYAEGNKSETPLVKQSKMLKYYAGNDGILAMYLKDETHSDTYRLQFHKYFLLGEPSINLGISKLPLNIAAARSKYFDFLGTDLLTCLGNLFTTLKTQEETWSTTLSASESSKKSRAPYPDFKYYNEFIKEFKSFVCGVQKRIQHLQLNKLGEK